MKKHKITRIILGGALSLALMTILSGWLLKSKVIPRQQDTEDDELEIEACGVERWAQKVLTDADTSKVNFTPKDASIKGLISIATPTISSNSPRQPQEYQLYKVHCLLTKLKLESDGDYHLVLSDSTGNTMIGEIPDPTCSSTTPSHHLSQFKKSRAFIDKHYSVTTSFQNLSAKVVVTGMAFIDPPHGQTGAAPNNLELHSILDIYYDTAKPVTSSIAVEIQSHPKINVYPNPIQDMINFHMESTEKLSGVTAITLYSNDGKEINVFNIPASYTNYSINRGNLKNGLYYYRANIEGKEVITGRILIY